VSPQAADPALDRSLLGEVSQVIAERTGLHFPEERWPDLARGLRTAGETLGFSSPDACARWLGRRALTPGQVETLASCLTVGETYFFRDPESFEALEREILPPLIARRSGAGRFLRLWSAGCCTGEEAYSLAITCARALPDIQDWNVSILATDINRHFLAKAETGLYTEWSFRGSPCWLREEFFSPALPRKLSIDPVARRLVRFDHLNLAEEVYPSPATRTDAIDVIFCRNVLMYLTPDHQGRVVAALHRCLADGGYLFVNPAEASPFLFSLFDMETVGGVTLYRRASPPGRGESPPEPVAEAPASPPVSPTASDRPATPTRPVAPKNAPPREDLLLLARAQADRGRLEEALEACRDALAVGRTDPAAHYLHATICSELGRVEDAIAALGKALYLDQDFILAHHALGGLYGRLGKKRESRRHLQVALDLLSARDRQEIVPGSEGMTCGRLVETVRATRGA
jgi:chemotaxis protein methyltransferase CheR